LVFNANDTLFINKIVGILEKYGVHTPIELFINPPSKHMGKPMIKKAINEYWYKKYNEEKSTKTTIRHLEMQKEPIGTPFKRSSIGVCIPYFSRIPDILLINNVSFALAFADSHSSICFSIVESSLAIPKNSGMSPAVQMKIWNTYVVPRFLYGLEVQNPTKTNIKKLEQLQRNVCRQFQC
jgi:hypothetical protein